MGCHGHGQKYCGSLTKTDRKKTNKHDKDYNKAKYCTICNI